MMNWDQLINPQRIGHAAGRPAIQPPGDRKRSPFQVDVDRIIFSSAFRRLQAKTQVHPLSDNDHVHTRLTHTIEVGSVGQSLGLLVGPSICEKLSDKSITPADIGYLVQAASLAHDIGNPPFGHSGESALRAYYTSDEIKKRIGERLTASQWHDLQNFEGNAQGFRIITQLEMMKFAGGLRLTAGTLGTFMKYPRPTFLKHPDPYVGAKKPGYYQSEAPIASLVAKTCGLIPRDPKAQHWCRHPLVYLVEAADDICYSVVDLEDGLELGCITFQELEAALAPIVRSPQKYEGDASARTKALQQEDWYATMSRHEKIGFLRGKAIANLVAASADAFLELEDKLLKGELNGDLLGQTPFAQACKSCKKLAKTKIYNAEHVMPTELAGFDVLHGLTDRLLNAALEYADIEAGEKKKPSNRSRILNQMLHDRLSTPSGFYHKLMRAMDYIGGMTDRYAVSLYQRLNGMSL